MSTDNTTPMKHDMKNFSCGRLYRAAWFSYLANSATLLQPSLLIIEEDLPKLPVFLVQHWYVCTL